LPGSTAATGRVEAAGLAWMLREDYARVGFRLIPQRDDAGQLVGRLGALVASLAFLWVGIRSVRPLTDDSARRVFLASLLFHPVLLCLMLADTVRI